MVGVHRLCSYYQSSASINGNTHTNWELEALGGCLGKRKGHRWWPLLTCRSRELSPFGVIQGSDGQLMGLNQGLQMILHLLQGFGFDLADTLR